VVDINEYLIQFTKTKHNMSRGMVMAVWFEIVSFYFFKDRSFLATTTTAGPNVEKPFTIEDHQS
jgi:hypothetical protein